MVRINSESKAIPESHQQKIDTLEQKFQNAALEIAKLDQKLHEPLYKERSEIVSSIPGFWTQVFVNLVSTAIYIDDKDHEALSHLTDLTLSKPADLRGLTLTFTFSDNKFFSNKTLVKTFTATSEAPQFPDFELAEDATTTKTKIDWKSDEVNLCKVNPTKGDPDQEDFEPGSFFSTFFDSDAGNVSAGIAATIAEELYPHALDIYSGKYSAGLGFDGLGEDDDEEDEDEDDEAEEIDLENDEPAKKKKKTQ